MPAICFMPSSFIRVLFRSSRSRFTKVSRPAPRMLAIATRISRICVRLANSFSPLSCTLMCSRKCSDSPKRSSFVSVFSAASSLLASSVEPAPGLKIVPGRISSRSSVQPDSSFKSRWSTIVPARSTPSRRSAPAGSFSIALTQAESAIRTRPPNRSAHSAVARSSPCAHTAPAPNKRNVKIRTALPAGIVSLTPHPAAAPAAAPPSR